MPIYIYKCPKCGYQSEELVLNKSENEKSCPKCGKVKLEKQPTSVSFKGGSACKACSSDCSTCY